MATPLGWRSKKSSIRVYHKTFHVHIAPDPTCATNAVILGMTMFPATTIKFEPLPVKSEAEWQVVLTYPSGKEEHVIGFKSETEAVNWIGSSGCIEWVRARGYG
jgi:hypothetical protein